MSSTILAAHPCRHAGMILLAHFPPRWFRVMNPNGVAHDKGGMRRASIKSALGDRVLAQYGGANA